MAFVRVQRRRNSRCVRSQSAGSAFELGGAEREKRRRRT